MKWAVKGKLFLCFLRPFQTKKISEAPNLTPPPGRDLKLREHKGFPKSCSKFVSQAESGTLVVSILLY